MANEFKPSEGRAVTKKEALDWIDKYDREFRKDKAKDTKSIFYGKEILEKLLRQDGVAGISFFLACRYNDHAKKDAVQLVLVGTKEDGTLLWPEDGAGKDGGGGTAADAGMICPPYCPK
jgi:hypothetical protein